MPAYPGNGLANLLNSNRTMYFWGNEIVPAATWPGSLSIAYQLERLPNVVYPWGLSFELSFSGNPGTFEIDILGANADYPQNYAYLGMINQVNLYIPGYYVGRWDMPTQMWPKYVAGYIKQLTNAVNVTLTVTR